MCSGGRREAELQHNSVASAGFQAGPENTARGGRLRADYNPLQWFINDLFTDTQSCRHLTSVAIWFAALLQKSDNGMFFQDILR